MNTLNLFAFLVGGGITITAFITIIRFFFIEQVDRAAEMITLSIWKSFLIGLINAAFFILIAALLFNFAQNQLSGLLAGLVNIIAVAIILALTILACVGLSGLNQWLEERIFRGETSFVSSLKSALLLVLSCMTPFVGWFLLTPFIIATSLGAAIQIVTRKKDKIAQP